MFIVYADSSLNDIKAIKPSRLEFAFGTDEQDFELVMDYKEERLDPFSFIYIEGSELGGMITNIRNDKELNALVYSGPCFQGLLSRKIIEPNPGEDYFTVSGEVNNILRLIISRAGLESYMSAPQTPSSLSVTNYSFNRYVDVYKGLMQMLESIGAVLQFTFKAGKIQLSAVAKKSFQEEFTTERFELPVNHLICLGQGDLKDRTVIHLYADSQGNVSQTQSLFGIKENSEIYDYGNAEDEDLLEDGIKKLQELQVFDSATLTDINGAELNIGDEISYYDPVTDLVTNVPIEKKIVSINYRGDSSTTYTAGTVTISHGRV